MLNLVDLVRDDFGLSGGGRWFRSDIHSSLVVDAENNTFFFNSRGLRGGPVDYLVGVRGLTPKVARDLVINKTANLPETNETGLQVKFEKLVDLFHSAGKNVREYWYKRGLTDPTIDRYRLGNFEEWNLIPIYDKGRFYNFQCRRDTPDKRIRFWYKDRDFKPVLFNIEILPFIDTVYIVEGLVDCILLNQLGLPSVCSINGADTWNSGWIRHFTKMKDIYFIADNDKAGIFGASIAAASLGTGRVKIMRFRDEVEKYGAKDYFVEGGTVEKFKSLIRENATYGFDKGSI